MAKSAMSWNLNPLVKSTKPEDIKVDLDELIIEAEKLASKYKGKIASLNAKELLVLFKRYADCYYHREGIIQFAFRKYDSNSLDPEAKQINDIARSALMKIQKMLAFFYVEAAKLISKNPKLINDPHLADYRHFLERLKRDAPYYLSDAEEQLVIQKDRFGIDSWYQLQGDWLSTRVFEIEVDGEKKIMHYGEIIALYEHQNRELRKEANRIVYDGLGSDEIIWASALRAIIGNHMEMCNTRKWPTPRTQSLIINDVDDASIDALMLTVENHVGLYRKYLKLKARLMNLPKLANYDVIAPLPNMPDRKFTWKEAQKITIDTYNSFDREIGDIVSEMFEKRRIDSEIRKGKRSGAYCASWYSAKTAFILQNFNEHLGDIFTLVHENGHAVHSTLMSQIQNLFNCDIGFCIAETGSMFGELLLADKLIAEAKTKEEKIEVIAKILDEFGIAVFQVSARYFFEMALYDAFKRGEYLDGDTIAKYWTQSRDKIYGKAVEWLDEMRWEWTMKVHYYRPDIRLYNYPYIYANLFVFALYRLYKEQGQTFVPKLRRLLSAGCSESPRTLAKELGFDISKPEFWALGMKQAEEFIKELESLVK
jgi:oligoendopeptidase F